MRSALHQPWPALDHGNHIAALNAVTRVVHCRARRVQRIHLHNNMDYSVPQHQHGGPQVQERLTHIVAVHSIMPNLSTHLVPHVRLKQEECSCVCCVLCGASSTTAQMFNVLRGIVLCEEVNSSIYYSSGQLT